MHLDRTGDLRPAQCAGHVRLRVDLEVRVSVVHELELPRHHIDTHAGFRDLAKRQEATARLAAGFQDVPVEVGVRFRATTADPVELSALAVGDVIRLRHPAEAPLDVTAADVVFAHATPGSHGQRLACLIVATPHQES